MNDNTKPTGVIVPLYSSGGGGRDSPVVGGGTPKRRASRRRTTTPAIRLLSYRRGLRPRFLFLFSRKVHHA